MLRFQRRHRGSNPLRVASIFYSFYGRLAQLVERYPYKVDVTSSSLVATTMTQRVTFRALVREQSAEDNSALA